MLNSGVENCTKCGQYLGYDGVWMIITYIHKFHSFKRFQSLSVFTSTLCLMCPSLLFAHSHRMSGGRLSCPKPRDRLSSLNSWSRQLWPGSLPAILPLLATASLPRRHSLYLPDCQQLPIVPGRSAAVNSVSSLYSA